MIVDKNWCMSSFLAFRYVADKEKVFRNDIEHKEFVLPSDSEKLFCKTVDDIEENIKNQLSSLDYKTTALLLSGGIDSGILASYVPENTVAYTVNSPAKVARIEIERASKVCQKYGLEHRVVDVDWDDYESCLDALMKHDGCPVFANEPQVYSLTKAIKEDGFSTIVFGDNADVAFGGYDRLLSKDWTFNEWVKRFTFVDPARVLKEPSDINEVYERYRTGENSIDYLRFLDEVFAMSSSGAYINSFNCLGMKYIDPYALLKMSDPFDLERIRRGESKYMLRELYKRRFPDFDIPEKIAMARAVDVWKI